MKLYKFRGLGTCSDVRRALEILDSGKFWFAPFHDLNDPMEGVFQTSAGQDDLKQVEALYSQKLKYGICSFSGPKGFARPAMWGYYANGFKGMAIEVAVRQGPEVARVRYTYGGGLSTIDGPQQIPALLTSKSAAWGHEHEYRILRETRPGLQYVGEITAVYFGDPFGDVVNSSQIYATNANLQGYRKVREFMELAAKWLGIPSKRVRVSAEGKVESFDWQL